jgi:hypothetical protein
MDLYSQDMDNKISKVADAVGVKETGSGGDHKTRGIGFMTPSEEKAKKFVSLVRKIPKVRATIG